MSHNSAVLIVMVAAIAGVLWTVFWLWVVWMALTVLRWHYLAIRAANRSGTLPALP